MSKRLLSRRPVVAFIVLACSFSWSVWLVVSQLTTDPNVQFVAQIPAGFGPAIAAATVVWATGGSLRAWVRDMASWRVTPRWYLAALGLPILFAMVESLVFALFVGSLDPTVLPQRLGFWVGSFLVALLLTGGNEEPGWRGFMQPRLQRSYSALTAAVIVGLVWTVWHLPLHVLLPALTGGFDGTSILSRIATVPLAILFAWLYNATDGSVLIAMLFHAGWNTSQSLIPAPFPDGTGAAEPDAGILWGARVVAVLIVVIGVIVVYERDSLAPTNRHTQQIG